jgi:foldase protein PrsA
VKRLLVCLIALVALAGVACGNLQAYAAIVNGSRIPQKDVDQELKAIKANAKYLDALDPSPGHQQLLGSGTNTFNSAFAAFVLNQDIDYLMVDREVARRKLKPSAADLDRAKQTVIQQVGGEEVYKAFPKWYQQKLQQRFANVIVLANALAGGADEAKAREYYQAHQSEFEQACTSHILVDSKAKADEIEAKLKSGQDFATLAKSESKDTGSAQKGGEIGCYGRQAQLVPEYLDASFAQPVGQPGPPVQSQFGYHIIKVTSRNVPPYDEVKDQVQQAIGQGGGQKLQDWITDALKKAKVTVNPKYGKFNKNKPVPQVDAPQAPPTATTTIPALPGGIGGPGQQPSGAGDQSPAPPSGG